ncbi:MAG TPA: hypothetical protein VMF58_15285 [Rhizomicrobium sp.]|nr:hypothetical protein [Rhizomicrobium sp.]
MGLVALPDWPWRKAFGAAAVVILHVAIVAVLLNATMVQRMFRAAPRETILYLQPLQKPQAKPQVVPPPKRAESSARRTAPVVIPQAVHSPTSPAPTVGPASKAESVPGYQLYDCRTANLAKLTPEARAACAKAQIGPKQDKGDAVDYADHTNQIPGHERWAREKARKNAPTLLPCASNQSAFVTASTATILCLAKGAINGFDLDDQPGYDDKPNEESHVPNNGDPPPMYKDPDH